MQVSARTRKRGDYHVLIALRPAILVAAVLMLAAISFSPMPVAADELTPGIISQGIPSVTERLRLPFTPPPTPTHNEAVNGSPGGITLTPEEYEQFKRVVEIGGAPASQVALVNLSVKGVGILLGGFAWILLLVILRRTFDFWFDEDLYHDRYLSCAVVITLIVCTALVLWAVLA